MPNPLHLPNGSRQNRWAEFLVLIVCHGAALAQPTPQPDSDNVTPGPNPAQVALAEGIYTHEYLGDFRQSIELYRRALAGAELTPAERALARFRLSRCFRAIDRPEPARRLLLELLREPSLGIGLRESSEHELRGLPAPFPARLMPVDTLVYIDTADFTELLGRFIELARASGEFTPPVTPPEQAAPLRGVISAGIGWHGFRSRQPTAYAASDVVILVFTDGSEECIEALELLARQWFGPARLDRIEHAPPSTAFRKAVPGRFWYAGDDDLFIICTDPYAGARAIGLHRGEWFAPENSPARMLREPPVPIGATARVYFDWRGLREGALGSSTDAQENEDTDFWGDLVVSLGALQLQDGALLLDFVTSLQSGPRSLYPVFRSGPRESDWPHWLPADASFSLVSSFTNGANRWREFVSRVLASPGGADPQWLRSLENDLSLRIADEVFEPIRDIALLWPDSGEAAAASRSSPWILAIHVPEAARWMATVDRCLRRLLLGPIEEADLPIHTLATPAGDVRVLSPTRGLAGISWIVREDEVLLAPSPDVLADFFSRESDSTPAALRPGERESKQLTVDIVRWARRKPDLAHRLRTAPRAAPMLVRSYEREDSIRIRLEQPQAHTVFTIYLEWLRDALRAPENRGTE